jgi:hypothetical protein
MNTKTYELLSDISDKLAEEFELREARTRIAKVQERDERDAKRKAGRSMPVKFEAKEQSDEVRS